MIPFLSDNIILILSPPGQNSKQNVQFDTVLPTYSSLYKIWISPLFNVQNFPDRCTLGLKFRFSCGIFDAEHVWNRFQIPCPFPRLPREYDPGFSGTCRMSIYPKILRRNKNEEAVCTAAGSGYGPVHGRLLQQRTRCN
jgi:hypothetical protein